MESCPKRPIEMQVASLMRKFEVVMAENKMLKLELVEVKEEMSEVKKGNEQVKESQQKELREVKEELKEVKTKNKHLQRALEKVQMAYNQLKKKQDTMKLDVDEQKLKCVSLQTHTAPLPVPPFYFMIADIEHYLKNNLGYDSQPFYSHPGGYKLAVTVIPNGYGSCQGTHLYLGVGLQRGEFDDQLRWPFKGKVTVQAYNRTTEKWSNEKNIVLSKEECGLPYVQRRFDSQTFGSWGTVDFLSRSDLRKHYISLVVLSGLE